VRGTRSSVLTATLLAIASTLVNGIASAQDKVSIAISPGARQNEPLPPGERIELALDRAIILALKNTLDLDVAAYGYEKSEYAINAARGIFDPYFALDLDATRTESAVFSREQASLSKTARADARFGGFTPFGTTYTLGWTNRRNDTDIPGFTIINPTYRSGLNLGVTQPLLRNFGTTVNRRFIIQARIARDQSAWDFVRQLMNTAQSVEFAYWDLVYALENLKARQEALARAGDLNRITRIKIDVGALAPIDIVQTEVTIAQREQDIILAEGAIGDAQDRLKRLLNVQQLADWSRPITPTDRPSDEPIKVDVEAGIDMALRTRPEVKQAVVDIEYRKITLAYQRNQVLPRLDFIGNYGYSGVGANTAITNPDNTVRELDFVDALYQIRGREFPAWSVGLSLNIPLFNRAARNNAAIAKTDVELSRTNLAIVKQNLVVDVRAAARSVDTSVRSVAAARKARELAERNLDAERKKYENGMTTSFQVAQIQNDLTNARSFELQAIASYQKSIAAWHRQIGDLLDEKHVTVEGLPVSLAPTPAEEGAVR